MNQSLRGEVLDGEEPGVNEGLLSLAGADMGAADAATESQKPARAIMVLNGVDVPSVFIG